jgi:hypothetical protein
MSFPNPNADRSMQSLLHPLPEFDPDPALWDRIHSVNVRRTKLRRARQAGIAGIVSVSLAAVWFGVGSFSSRFGSAPPSVTLLQKNSQVLQDQFRSIEQTRLDPAIQARIHWIDNDLQAAYDRGANEGELASLWAQRSALLQSLVRPGDVRASAVTRI